MIKFLRKLLLPELNSELYYVKTQLALSEGERKALKEQIFILEDERKELIDRIMAAAGVPMLYKEPPPRRAEDPNDRLRGQSQARDWSREATILENLAMRTSQKG